jgi:hypothetical protein
MACSLPLRMQGLTVEGIESGKLTIDGGNYGSPSAGEMTFSWSEENGVSAGSDEVLFTVMLKAEQSGKISEMVELGSWTTRAESYSGEELGVSKVDLRIGKEDEVGGFALYQNEPNPFRTITSIGYQIPNPGTVELKVCDIAGRVLFTREINSSRGYNSVEIDRKLFPATGIYYYTVTSGSFTATKGLVVLE